MTINRDGTSIQDSNQHGELKMDCCGKTKETDKDIIKEQAGIGKNPVENEHNHRSGCCGGGTKDLLLHLVLMIVAFLIISYLLKR